MSIRIGILGYGNLGRGVECAVRQNPDMELAAVFTRRNPEDVHILTETASVCRVSEAADWKDKIDVMILCGGSATDLPEHCPVFPGSYETMDFAFDLSGQNLKFPGSLSGFFPLSFHLSIQPQQIMFHDTGQSRQQFLDFPDCVYSLVILLLLCHLQEISYDVCAAVLLR